jgi:hypothetical protein
LTLAGGAIAFADCWDGMFPDSGRRFLSDQELASLEEEELWMARNEIFARHGLIFSTQRGIEFAQGLCGYNPDEPDPTRVQPRFNQYELRNVERISRLEKARKAGQKPSAPMAGSLWIFPDSDRRNLTDAEIQSLLAQPDGAERVWRARNEIYARHGYVFQTPKGRAYARSLGSAYNGDEPDAGRVLQRFNAFERYNVELLRKYDKSR